MIRKIAFTVYPVQDMARARRFYEQDLGLSTSREFAEGAWVEYDLDNGCFAITTLAKGVSPNENAGGSVGFEVEDLDRLLSGLKAKGVRVKLEPFSTPVCRIAVIVDSEGNALTLHQILP